MQDIRNAQAHETDTLLRSKQECLHNLCHIAKHDREHASHLRIERPAVPCPSDAQYPLYPCRHLVAGWSAGLIEIDHPIPQQFFDRPVLWRAAVSRVWCTPRFYEDACVCIRCASTGGCVVFMMVVSLVLHLFLSFFFSVPRASTHSDL